MNVNDSEVLAGYLERAGYALTVEPRDADIILINTCSIRERAEQKAKSFLGEVKKLKVERPEIKVGVCGCMASREKTAIFEELPFVDLVLGPRNLVGLDKILARLEKGERILQVDNELPVPDEIDLPFKRTSGVQAWVTVMYGCDHNCTYCVVPSTRGREVSRPRESVVREVEQLDKDKHKEIVLLGQNIDSYGKLLGYGLDALFRDVNEIDGVDRIRFFTSHPHDLTPEIIRAVAEVPKVCEFFHLPVQHGDDTILRRMARIYTVAYYKQLVQMIRSDMPDATITTDIIVGFPGETEEHFRRTLDLVEEMEFDACITAAFSPRPNTPSADFPGVVPEEVKKERLGRLNEIAGRSALRKNEKLLGTTQEVLLEKESEDQNGIMGRTRGNKWVRIPKNGYRIGETIPVRIEKAGSWNLEGSCAKIPS